MTTPKGIRPQRRNANRHTQRGMGMLEGSIERDGIIGALTVAADDEVFDGSARAETLPAMGFDLTDVAQVVKAEPGRVLIIESDGSSPLVHRRVDIPSADDPKAQRLGVAANRVAQANLDWDPGVLAEVNDEAGLGALFFPDELKDLAQPSAPEPGEDAPVAIDETQPTRCQPGDVWRVGRHTVACVDSTDQANVERLIAGRKVGMVWSDAPYGIDIVTADGYVGGGEKYDIPFGGKKGAAKRLAPTDSAHPFGRARPVVGTVGADNIVRAGRYAPVAGDEDGETARTSATLLLDIYPDAVQIWWGANHFSDVFPASPCWIVWDKENTGNFADAELAWCSDDSAVRIFRHMWNGMVRASEHGKRVHPTQKPIALCAWAFEKYGSAGDLILDPFLGSGPSLKAAESMGRTVVGFELSPHYIDHILDWAEQHGLTVERVETPMEA